jgi:hypothetical protein
MFIQVMQGRIADAEHLRRQVDRWRSELKPGARGYLGATSGVTSDGRAVTLVRFESEDAARANAARPEQGAWWAETAKAFDGDVTFHDCNETDSALGGGSNDAGFVQVLQGRAKNQKDMRKLLPTVEKQLHDVRPDILGITIGWHGDGRFTQAVYFKSEKAARDGESAKGNEELREQFMSNLDGQPVFFDLTAPDLD